MESQESASSYELRDLEEYLTKPGPQVEPPEDVIS